MNLVGTLAKVAMGVMVARGVGKMMGKKTAGGGGLLGGGGSQAGGGLLGSASNRGGSSFEDMVGEGRSAAPQPQASGGGLGGLLGGLLGGGASAGGVSGAGAGGLGGLLGGVLSGGGGQSGGLGGLLNSLGGKQGQSSGGLGGLLNQALGGKVTPEPKPDENAQAEIMLRAMINAAKSDGEIDQEEQQKILSHLGEVSQAEIDFVRNEMVRPLDIHEFIRSVPKGLEQQVYLMSLLGIRLDSRAEAQYLDHLAQGMGIAKEIANQIHTKVGVPLLYG